MTLRRTALAGALAALALAAPAAAQQGATPAGQAPPPAGETPRSLPERLDAIEAGLAGLEAAVAEGASADVQARATRIYLDEFEAVEAYWGPNGPLATAALGEEVVAAEAAFHALMTTGADEAAARVADLRGRLDAVRGAATASGATLVTDPSLALGAPVAGAAEVDPSRASSPEIRGILEEIESAREAWRAGDSRTALARVEHAYLEGLEPIEPTLPSGLVATAERAIHLGLRPALAREAPAGEVEAAFDAVEASLVALDGASGEGGSFWLSAFSAFAIILREGLEAVLLIGAILAYLSRVSDDPRHRRQVWAGVGIGVAASLATWVVARTVIPVGGGSRELIEGVTALLAVGVLLYVSHWLFQKTYIHDWKEYLREKVGVAIGTGSALAMAGLAFAAVYREGFETVLFYQALLFDAGAGAVLAGFLPGLVLIVAVGAGILKLGLKLPLRQVFAATNAILLYLAFVFLGKGLYNLQEAGLFAPHPVGWMPDHEALRLAFGIYPVAETLLAQATFLLLLGVTWGIYRSRAAGRKAAPAARAAEEKRAPTRPAEESVTT